MFRSFRERRNAWRTRCHTAMCYCRLVPHPGYGWESVLQGILPGTISSDLHQGNINGPVYDLATTMSKFLHLGVSLEEVIRRVTSNPARTFAFPTGTGSLKEGTTADVAVFELRDAPWEMVDSMGESRPGRLRLRPMATVKAGRIYGNSVIPVYR